MSTAALQVLSSVFGYEAFRGQQQAIIQRVIDGLDALVLMPTGGGKSLCYQIPALVRPGVGIVVSPLIALMQDQVQALCQLGVKAACLHSALTPEEASRVELALHYGEIDLLYLSPERLLQSRTLNLLDQMQLALFAFDEAHCVSHWGHDFRPEYLQLGQLGQRYPGVPRLALTATADMRTRQEMLERLQLEQAETFISSFDRPNIFYRVVEKNNTRQQLLRFLRREHAGDAGIVYCLSRKKVEETASWLSAQGIPALPYHAGLSNEQRSLHQDRFIKEEGLVIVATIAFGMGINKPDVRFVAHLDLPKSLEAYYQETGRAGRDGLPANAWMAYGLRDLLLLQQILGQSQADERIKRVEAHKLEAMLGFCEVSHCRRQSLLAYFGETLEQPCGHCDVCVEPAETWNATEAARKALSCVFRTHQRYGVGHLIDVLRGKASAKVVECGHDQVSTFAIGKALSTRQWRSLYRQLIARGYLAVDLDGYGALRLTEQCRPLLRGEESLLLRKVRDEAVSEPSRVQLAPQDQPLWNALRERRMQLAREQDVPPYVIFHDATLREILRHRPRSLHEMGQLSGIGQRKLERYGAEFLEVLAQFDSQVEQPDTRGAERELLALLRSGLPAEQLAGQFGLSTGAVWGIACRGVQSGVLDPEHVLDFDPSTQALLESLLVQQGMGPGAVRAVIRQFGQPLETGPVRCLQAALLRAGKISA